MVGEPAPAVAQGFMCRGDACVAPTMVALAIVVANAAITFGLLKLI